MMCFSAFGELLRLMGAWDNVLEKSTSLKLIDWCIACLVGGDCNRTRKSSKRWSWLHAGAFSGVIYREIGSGLHHKQYLF